MCVRARVFVYARVQFVFEADGKVADAGRAVAV